MIHVVYVLPKHFLGTTNILPPFCTIIWHEIHDLRTFFVGTWKFLSTAVTVSPLRVPVEQVDCTSCEGKYIKILYSVCLRRGLDRDGILHHTFSCFFVNCEHNYDGADNQEGVSYAEAA
uniref:(northern house mosquito) hypothetical protein n=1 Tax=Culex pipiens TaxID=7175 RepID=A0A8D7ZS87_CULPI